MKNPDFIQQKIFTLPKLLQQVDRWKFLGKKIAFTNGCFDILHEGHIFSLSQAAREGDVLVVGVNADASTKRLKGPNRPVNNEHSRALLMASLLMVDAVVIFEEDTPLELIQKVRPDVLVKGSDYKPVEIVGHDLVTSWGGKVQTIDLTPGFSSTQVIGKLTDKR